jgi:hypothetical protein
VILQIIIGALASFVNGLVSALPTGTWHPDVSAVQAAVGQAKGVDAYLPVSEALACLGIAFLVAQAELVWSGAMWLYRHIPFAGG